YSALFMVGLAMASRIRRATWWDWPLALAIALATPAAYQIFRMGYYALLAPNTALAKDATDTRWLQGLNYLVDYAGLYVLLVPLLVGALGTGLHMTYAWRTRSQARWAVVGAPLLAAVMHVAYIVRVGGDFMHARFLLPDTFAVLMPAAIVGITLAWRQLALVATAFVAGWAVAIASSARTPYAEEPSLDGIANERVFWSSRTITGDVLTRNDWLAGGLGHVGTQARWDLEAGWSYYDNGSVRLDSATGEGVYVAVDNLGIISIAAGTDVMVIDKLALSDGITSHSRFDPRLVGTTRIGHAERPDAWRVARYARFRVDEPIRITHARLALQCGDLAVLQDAITGDLTTEKFWQNVRLAPHLTFFTFPADPASARKELCGWNPGW
ncbi:MAG: hypothetical protein Q4G46_14360, partial [Propionibacteriaceae bacterium]|nr:hypothetical protein [Propionibacteriaceae bacterium]